MELSHTLRAHLDALEPHLSDPAVTEFVITGPNRARLTRSGESIEVLLRLPAPRLRALADRLVRELGGRAGDAVASVHSGALEREFEFTVFGAPYGSAPPLVRLVRCIQTPGSLEALVAAGLIDAVLAARLLERIAESGSILLAGPHRAPFSELLAALTGAWAERGRVVVLEQQPRGPFDSGPKAPLFLAPEFGLEAAVALGADAVILPQPRAAWTDLLSLGRPFVACIEAPDGDSALMRLVALMLASSRALTWDAARALVLSSISCVVELSPRERGRFVARLGAPAEHAGAVRFEGEDDRLEAQPNKALSSERSAPPDMEGAAHDGASDADAAKNTLSESGRVAPVEAESFEAPDEYDFDAEGSIREGLKNRAPSASWRAVRARQETLLAPPDPSEVEPAVLDAWRRIEASRRASETTLEPEGSPPKNSLGEASAHTFATDDSSNAGSAADATQALAHRALLQQGEGEGKSVSVDAAERPLPEPILTQAGLFVEFPSEADEDLAGGFEEERTPVASLFKPGPATHGEPDAWPEPMEEKPAASTSRERTRLVLPPRGHED